MLGWIRSAALYMARSVYSSVVVSQCSSSDIGRRPMGAAVRLSAPNASRAPGSWIMQVHRQHVDDVVAGFHTDLRRGLTDAEVQTRRERYGRNELATEKPTPAWVRFVAQFQDALVILLLIATAISVGLWAYEGGTGLPYEAMAILAVVLLNAVLGYVQQARAEAAVAALRDMSAADATVIRNGERRTIPAAEIVPGDIVLIEEGDTIPADGRLVESAALQTAEAALTGESLPVFKDTDVIADEVALADRHNMIFSGTAATYGHGKAVVIAAGVQEAK